jgi:hypothetical protein
MGDKLWLKSGESTVASEQCVDEYQRHLEENKT